MFGLIRAITTAGLVLAISLAWSADSNAAQGGGHGGGGGGARSSLTLVVLDSSDGLAHAGQNVTFTVSTTATSSPFVSVNCYRGSEWIYTSSAGFFPAYPWPQVFTLSSTAWSGGDADCTARLYSTVRGTKTTTLATLSFHVWP